MKVEILKNRETWLVIDDLGRAIKDDNILLDCYLKAIQALEKYIEQTKQIREQLSTNGNSESQINDILYQSPHNIIAFLGKRGAGKTSAMLSFSEFLNSGVEKSKEAEELWKKHFDGLRALVLSPIDPTMLENDQDILSIVLSRLLYKAEERWNRNFTFRRDVQNLEKEKNELLKKANACLNGIQAIKKKGEIKGLADLQRVGDSAVLKKNLFDLVNVVNAFCLDSESCRKESGYLVIPIDDTDCQIQKAHEVMEDIRRYLTIPNVLILMATDGDMLRKVFAQHYADEFKLGLNNQLLETIEVEHYAEKYLTKLIPSTHRVYLPMFENIIQNSSVKLSLGYYGDELRDTDLISGSTRLGRDKKNKENDNTGIDNNFQAKILTFIYQRTGIVFSEHAAYINNIIPTTMRGLAHLLNFLLSMEKVEEIDYTKEYTPSEFLCFLESKFQKLDHNLDLFEEYFMNEWVPVKASHDMVNILREIEEQVPENLVQYTILEMYENYIKGINYPLPPFPSYYDLMELIFGIIGTTFLVDLPKAHRNRQDYYNIFAVCTLLTIKNNKQAIKYRLKALESIVFDGANQSICTLDYSSCVLSDSFPQRNDVKDYDTAKREKGNVLQSSMIPVMEIYKKLLQNKIQQSGEKSQIELYCIQELSWIILCNWDVQDIIFKSINTY